MNGSRCDECGAIAQELRNAYVDAWTSCDQVSRDAWIATYRLIDGTGDDVTHAEQMLPHARFQDPLRINRALLQKFNHEARWGHKVPMPGKDSEK